MRMKRQHKKMVGRGIYILFLCAFLMLGLCACEKGGDKEETAQRKERGASVDNGSLNNDSVVIAVGKTTVTYKEYKVYDHFMKTQYEDILTEDVWNYKADGAAKSIGQEAVEDVVRLIIQVQVINRVAQEQGVELAADEKEAASHNASQYYAALGEEEKGEGKIEQAVLTKIFEQNRLAEKMYNIVLGKVNVNVTQEQARAARVQLIFLSAADNNKEEVRQRAEQLAAEAKNRKGSFYRLAKQNTQLDEVESLVGQLDARPNLVSAVLGMKTGAVSDVIQETNGFYIAYCVEAVNDSLNEEYKKQVVEERQTKAFQDEYATWSEKFGVRVSKSLLAADAENGM